MLKIDLFFLFNKFLLVNFIVKLIIQVIQNMQRLSELHNDSSIYIPIGEQFEISLEENSTTGYEWELGNFNTSIIKLVKNQFLLEEDSMGAAGTRIFRFQTVSLGQTSINIKYWQPWAGDSSSEKNYSLKIIIK